MDRPCGSVTISDNKQGPGNILQGNTNINPCVTSNATGLPTHLFRKTNNATDVFIRSDIHAYGAEHLVSIGNVSATFSARVFYSLNDERMRLMAQAKRSPVEFMEMKVLYWQFMAYLFTFYNISTGDVAMGLDRLNSLNFQFDEVEGRDIQLLQVNGETVTTPSRGYTLSLNNVIVPQGPIMVRFAQHFFRGSAVITIGDANEKDLFFDSGVEKVHSVIWREKKRTLNWLSLLLMTSASLLLLAILRMTLNPLSMTGIASVMVKSKVGADLNRSPVEVARNEDAWVGMAALLGDQYYQDCSTPSEEAEDWYDQPDAHKI